MRRVLTVLAVLGAAGLAACAQDADVPAASATEAPRATAASATARDTLVVFKSPTCGCCRLWGDHMDGEGFAVVSRDVTDLPSVKDSLGVPAALGSCHTGLVGGYVIEGHVPASVVRQLLRDRPDARGLAVPGMPLGSPGMEQGDVREPYDVLLVARDGSTSVYASIPGTSGS